MTDRELMRQAVVALDLAMLHGEYPQDAGIFREISNAANALSARLAQPEPEPVAWISAITGDMTVQNMSHTVSWAPLYTALQKKEWVGLTHEEKMEILTRSITAPSRIDVAEAKLKEKNT